MGFATCSNSSLHICMRYFMVSEDKCNYLTNSSLTLTLQLQSVSHGCMISCGQLHHFPMQENYIVPYTYSISHRLPATSKTTIAQCHIGQPSHITVAVTHFLLQLHTQSTLACSRNVGDVSVPSLAHSVPSPAAELHTGGQEGKEPDHSTAVVPVLRV